jgi:hypothetical protein
MTMAQAVVEFLKSNMSRVKIAETSKLESVQSLRAAYEEAKRKER